MTTDALEAGTELECGLIAACWEDPGNTQLLLGTLSEQDFASATGRQQFRALRKCWQLYRNCEVPSLKKLSADAGVLESWHVLSEAFFSGRWAGYGAGYLKQLMAQVRDNAGRVRLSRALAQGKEILSEDCTLTEAAGRISQLLTQATAVSIRHEAESWDDGLGELAAAITERLKKEAEGVEPTDCLSTGLEPLDEVLGGYGESELIVVAARPKVGKTAFMLQTATHIAKNYGTTLILSLELSRKMMWSRVAVQQRGTPLSVMMRRPDLVELVREQQAKLWIDDSPLKPDQLQQRIELFRLEHPDLKAVFLDHLGILAGDGADYKATSYAINVCRRAMKATGLPIVVLVQISRKAEDRNEGRPSLADLKMSGCIEEDARKVVLLHRRPLYVPEGKCDPFEALAIVAKNGEGQEGDVALRYNGSLFTFYPAPKSQATERQPGRDFPVHNPPQFVEIDEDLF